MIYAIVSSGVSFFLGVALTAVIVRVDVERRITRLETKMDMIITYFNIDESSNAHYPAVEKKHTQGPCDRKA